MTSQASIFSLDRSSPAPSSSISRHDDTKSIESQRKRRKIRATGIWEHFREPNPKERAVNNQNQRLHYCIRCIRRLWSTASTTNAIQHLQTAHRVVTSHLEPERIFSSSRRVLSWDRARLGDKVLEHLVCIKHWKRSGHISLFTPSVDA